MREKDEKFIDLFLELASFHKKIFMGEINSSSEIEVLPPNLQICFILISNHRFTNMSSLSKAMGISNQQLTRVIDDLEKRGYVTRVKDPNNQRQIYPILTEKGIKRTQLIRQITRERIEKKFKGLDEQMLDELIKSLENIISIFNQVNQTN